MSTLRGRICTFVTEVKLVFIFVFYIDIESAICYLIPLLVVNYVFS
jgi:hypothetical protein